MKKEEVLGTIGTLKHVITHMDAIERLGYTVTVTPKTETVSRSRRKPPASKRSVKQKRNSLLISSNNPQGRKARAGYKAYDKRVRAVMAENGCTYSVARSLLTVRKKIQQRNSTTSPTKREKLAAKAKAHWRRVHAYAEKNGLTALEAQKQMPRK